MAIATVVSVVFHALTKAVSASTRWATIPPPSLSCVESLAGSNRRLHSLGNVPLPRSLIGICVAEPGRIVTFSFVHTTYWILTDFEVMDMGAMRLLQLPICNSHLSMIMDMPLGLIMSIPISMFAWRPSTIHAPRVICATAGCPYTKPRM